MKNFFRYCLIKKKITVPPLAPIQLPDPTDLPFLEVASMLDDPILVTGNTKHFPTSCVGHVKILLPREAWDLLQTKMENIG